MRALVSSAAALVAMVVSGCDDSIHQGWLVDRPRVLGARVEALDDPARASLAPGERGRVTWLLAVPEGLPSFDWAFAACVPPDGYFAAPRCDGEVLTAGVERVSGELATMELEVPAADALGGAEELLVLAAFCRDGEVELAPATFTASCASGEPLLASVLVKVGSGAVNRNPEPPALRLGERILVSDEEGERGASVAAGAPCDEAPDAARVRAGDPELELVHVFDGAQREPEESLLLSTVVTGGELDRLYSGFEPEERAPKEVRVSWTPPGPERVGSAGRIERLYAVLRDGRGGANFGRFAVCVSSD